MTEILTCREYSWIPVRPKRREGEYALSEAQVRELAASQHVPSHSWSWGRNGIRWRQFCGVVQLGNLTLEILPKLNSSEADWQGRSLLVRMLAAVGQIKIYAGTTASIAAQRYSLLDLFILEFCSQLESLTRAGRPRDYRQRQANLSVVKGKLLIEQQIKHNLVHQERVFCRHDEFSEDILLHQVIKFCLRFLLAKCGGQQARQAVMRQLHQHDGITDRYCSLDTLEAIHLNRSNNQYEGILAWCRVFLAGQHPDVSSGQHSLFSMLFDMNVLFERWVATKMRPVLARQGLRLKEQQPRRFLAIREDSGQEVFQTRPDMAIYDAEGKLVEIWDAKWKLLKQHDSKLGIAQQDMYQLTSYANLYGVSRLALFYPACVGLESEYKFRINGLLQANLWVRAIEI